MTGLYDPLSSLVCIHDDGDKGDSHSINYTMIIISV